MIELNEINIQLNNIFVIFFNILSTFLNNRISINNILEYETSTIVIKIILLFSINNIYLLNKLIIKIKEVLSITKYRQDYLLNKINNIEKILNNKNTEILDLYNTLSQKEVITINSIPLLKKINYNTTKKIQINLDIYPIDNLELSLIDDNNFIDPLLNYNKNSNYLGFKNISIGFNNHYNLHCYQYLKPNLPLNLLLYVQEVDQVIIKIGNNKQYKYVNSKLYKVYNTYDSTSLTYFNENKFNSILCNNNIKELNKKCYSDNCKYYHDYILGYADNIHKTRYYSSNPIVYNCPSFKDGSKIKENVKKIPWYNAINLYQSSLSNLLLGCIHSQYKNEE
jgi:hypothetical protein